MIFLPIRVAEAIAGSTSSWTAVVFSPFTISPGPRLTDYIVYDAP